MPAEVVKADACIIGAGIAGFAAAVALRQAERSVVVLAKSGGASSVASGAWDLGPVPSHAADFASLRRSTEGERLYRSVLVDDDDFAAPSDVRSALEAVTKALEPELPMTLALDEPLCLPTPFGTWKRTYAAHRLQAGADRKALVGKKVALLASRQWRFPSDTLAARWNEAARAAGVTVDITPLWIELRGADWPLPQIATRLHHDERFRELFTQYIRTALGESSFDLLLFPPLFLDVTIAERLHEALQLPIAEVLSGGEPVAGHRTSEAIRRALARLGVPLLRDGNAAPLQPTLYHRRVTGLKGAAFDARAARYLLATGKYFGGGLTLGTETIDEPLFKLPLFRARGEARLAARRLLPGGERDSDEAQPWAAVGVHVDKNYRPVDELAQPCVENLFATGSLLGGVDFAKHHFGAGFMAFTGFQSGRMHG